jgi:5-methylcytosine-specific restriction endonuclease McrA
MEKEWDIPIDKGCEYFEETPEYRKKSNEITIGRVKLRKSFREQILLRDRYRCRVCKKKPRDKINKEDEPELQIHHIIWVSWGGKNQMENLVTVCSTCHEKLHKISDREIVRIVVETSYDEI